MIRRLMGPGRLAENQAVIRVTPFIRPIRRISKVRVYFPSGLFAFQAISAVLRFAPLSCV